MARSRGLSASLLTRILLVETLTIAAACVVMPLLARQMLARSVAAIERQTLEAQARQVANGLRRGPDGRWQVVLGEALGPIYDTGYDGRAYALVDGQGQVLAASRFAGPSIGQAIHQGTGAAGLFTTGSLVGLSWPVARPDAPRLHVVVIQDQAGPGAVLDDLARVFLSHYLVWLVALLLVMPAINGVVLWHSFHRLRLVARQAAAIGPQTLHTRLSAEGLPAEAGALVGATNDLLERIEGAFRQQEEFAGNVAHELRQPLAALNLRVAMIEDEAARTALARPVARMGHVLTQLRDLATLEAAARVALRQVDLAELVVNVVAEQTPRFLAARHTIAVTGADAPVRVEANPGLLTMALSNLLENALIHTPPGTDVEVIVAPGRFTVADNGPGIAESDRARVPRRFWRADHRRSDGAGLGLSIIQRIAEAHHGRLEIGPSAEGGAAFVFEWPVNRLG